MTHPSSRHKGKMRRTEGPSSDESFHLSSPSESSSDGSDDELNMFSEVGSLIDRNGKGKALVIGTSDCHGNSPSEVEIMEHDDARGRRRIRKEKVNARKAKEFETDQSKRISKRAYRRRETRSSQLFWEIWEKENDKWLNAHEQEDAHSNSNDSETVPETMEPSMDVTLPLLRYQKEWLAWAFKQEDSDVKGGILADEMGMGKTIQAISLVLTARSIRHNIAYPLPSSSLEVPQVGATLVVCPVVAVVQWVNEISRFTVNGSVRVLVYHGPQREKGGSKQFSDYDFVITTYSTIEADYRKTMMTPKERCKWCGKMFQPDKMAVHLKYLCGPDAVKTEKQAKQVSKKKDGSKIDKKKMDSSFEDDSETEIVKAKKKMKNQRQKKKKQMIDVSADNSSAFDLFPQEKRSALHSLKWERIILDEAHYIKAWRSNTARAILSLESTYKWALSGTPLQNRVEELYSLIRFLQVVPYSFYFCKDCDCKSLDYSKSKECPHCKHSATRHFCWWNRSIAKPIQKYGNKYEGRRGMILLKKKLMPKVVLRRTKAGRAADLALPPRIVSVRKDSFDDKEEDFYEALYSQSQAQFNTYIEKGTLMNNYAHIFDLLTRLRQAVDHPYLVVYSTTSSASSIDKTDDAEQICGICHEPTEVPVVTSCEHHFCKACLLDYSAALGQVSCPSCSKPLTVDFTVSNSSGTTVKGFRRSSILNKICLEDFQTSTKIEALREEIRFMLEDDGSAKGIVFSQFTSFLDLIRYSLQKSGIKCVQLVGSMSISARDVAIKKFTNDHECKIFLMSLKAGGVALNLTVASYVFLMDPWWNPAVEQQAQDRIHRIGQYKPVRTVRFVIENSIEEGILRLQEKKQLVVEGTVGGSAEALGRLTEADLRFLFHS